MALENTAGRGTFTHYGPRVTQQQYGGEVAGEHGLDRVISMVFDYDDLPVAGDDERSLSPIIPAGAVIKSSELEILTVFDGTTPTISYGCWDVTDDLVEDADGLDVTVAADALGATAGNGALIGTIAANDLQVTAVQAAGTSTQGRARITVVYQVTPAQT